MDKAFCLRLKVDCIPGRPGCVLGRKSGFAFSFEERIAATKPKQKLQVRGAAEKRRKSR